MVAACDFLRGARLGKASGARSSADNRMEGDERRTASSVDSDRGRLNRPAWFPGSLPIENTGPGEYLENGIGRLRNPGQMIFFEQGDHIRHCVGPDEIQAILAIPDSGFVTVYNHPFKGHVGIRPAARTRAVATCFWTACLDT